MSKKTSKLSRKCANKNAQLLMDNYMNKSCDDFEDDTKHLTRNAVKKLNNDSKSALKKPSVTTSKKSIHSVCKEFAVDNSSKKEYDKANKLKAVSTEKRIEDANSLENKAQNIIKFIDSQTREADSNMPCKNYNQNQQTYTKVSEKDTNSSENLDVSDKNQLCNKDVKIPPCPLCGKDFRSNHEKRTAHLKECGSLHGMRTEDLIKVRRLEEKQAAEWKALGLPNKIVPEIELKESAEANSGISLKVNSNQCNAKKSRKRRKADEKIIIETSNDPNLEMALALSASLAQKQSLVAPQTSSSGVKANQDLDLEQNTFQKAKGEILNDICIDNADDKLPDVIMPTATCWWKKTSPLSKNKSLAPKKGCNRRQGKTKLELITNQERSTKISEEVAKILTGQERINSEVPPSMSIINENGKDFHFYSSPQRQRLRCLWKNEKEESKTDSPETYPKNLWEKSKFLNRTNSFYIEAFKKYKPEHVPKALMSVVKNKVSKEEQNKNGDPIAVNDTNYTQFNNVCQDFEAILDSGIKSDLTIYSRNEEPLKCHTLVLYARCKQILEDIIRQKTQNGQEEAVICWNSYDYCVIDKLLRYLYCGKLPNNIDNLNEWEQHKNLSKCYGISEYAKHISRYDKSTFTAEMADKSRSQDQHETTGGFLGEKHFSDEANNDELEENMGGITQKLDLLLNEFDANLSTNEKEQYELVSVAQTENNPLLNENSEDEEWNDVHDYLTQKPNTSSALKANAEIDLTAKSIKTPDRSQLSNDGTSRSNEYSQQCRSDSPDMFADEDDCNLDTSRKLSATQRSKSTEDDSIFDISQKHKKMDIDTSALRLHHSESNLPIQNTTCNFENSRLEVLTLYHSLPTKVRPETYPKSPFQEKERSLIDLNSSAPKPSDDELPKLSTPVDFSDNEDFDDIYLGTQDQYAPMKTPEKSNFIETNTSTPVSNPEQINQEKENSDLCRISSIRLKLKSIDVTNIKTIEVILQELLSMNNITVDILLKTGIGKTVKEIGETCLSEIVKRKAGLLVSRWTLLVNRHIESQEVENDGKNDLQRTPSLKDVRDDSAMITPRPQYEAMMTPVIRKELRKFGIRTMSKNKAIPLLDHIYKETHPIFNMQGKQNNEIISLDKSFDNVSTSSNDSTEHELMEESILLNNQCDLFSQNLPPPTDSSPDLNLRDLVIKFIQSDKDLYNKCLIYEPFWLEQFFADFKPFALSHNLSSKQINLKLVTDILDNECLTFRTGASANRNRVSRKKTGKTKRTQTSSQRGKGKKRLSSTQTEVAPTTKRGKKHLYATQS